MTNVIATTKRTATRVTGGAISVVTEGKAKQ